jgi:hypothetical protein
MVQLDLDEAVEADLAAQASARGIRPEQLAAALVRAGLRAELAGESLREMRHEVIEAIKRDRRGHTLGLNGMSVREFAHLDHKY